MPTPTDRLHDLHRQGLLTDHELAAALKPSPGLTAAPASPPTTPSNPPDPVAGDASAMPAQTMPKAAAPTRPRSTGPAWGLAVGSLAVVVASLFIELITVPFGGAITVLTLVEVDAIPVAAVIAYVAAAAFVVIGVKVRVLSYLGTVGLIAAAAWHIVAANDQFNEVLTVQIIIAAVTVGLAAGSTVLGRHV